MEEKESIKIEELFSYGMSKEGFEKLLEDIKNAVGEGKQALAGEIDTISEEDKNKLKELVSSANESIDNSLKDIEELFVRIISDWDKEKGDTNE